MNPLSESRLVGVHPTLADKVRTLAAMLEPEGIALIVVVGVRSWAAQAAEYAKGRDAGGNVVDRNAVVTDAPPGHSWHQYGLAVDTAPETPNGTVDWNADHPQWKRIEAVGTSLGLVSGAFFKRLVDAPHLQLTGRLPVSPDDEARQLFKDGGGQAVWDAAQLAA